MVDHRSATGRTATIEASRSVASRRYILAELERRAASGDGALVIVVKVEGMKSFNHAHGIRMGDRLLDAIGSRILSMVGTPECVGHLSGDVFLILDERRDSRWVEAVVGEAGRVLEQLVVIDDVEIRPRVKIGIARAEPGEADADRLLVEASAAMRAAEASRSNIVVTADKNIRAAAHIESVIDRDIEHAMGANELTFAYQPLVTLSDSVIHGAEALLRWNHPELGALNPALIIERIEAVGLTRNFTEWSVETIAREWSGIATGPNELQGISVSMNFNEAQLADQDCVSMIERALLGHGLTSDGLIIEVVESGHVAVGERAEATLRELADLGCPIVLDDFGTGFNALDYFLRFPVHALKFDRSLVASASTNRTALVIMRGMAQITEELGMATVAEGVETDDESSVCNSLGLTFGQGWHFGRPVPLEEFATKAKATRAGVNPADLERPALA